MMGPKQWSGLCQCMGVLHVVLFFFLSPAELTAAFKATWGKTGEKVPCQLGRERGEKVGAAGRERKEKIGVTGEGSSEKGKIMALHCQSGG